MCRLARCLLFALGGLGACGGQAPSTSPGSSSDALDSDGAMAATAAAARAWHADAKLIGIQSTGPVDADGRGRRWTVTWESDPKATPDDNVGRWIVDGEHVSHDGGMRFELQCYRGLPLAMPSSGHLISDGERCLSRRAPHFDAASAERVFIASESCTEIYSSNVDLQTVVERWRWNEGGVPMIAATTWNADGSFVQSVGPCAEHDNACLYATLSTSPCS